MKRACYANCLPRLWLFGAEGGVAVSGCVPAMPTANWLLAWDQSSLMLPRSKESKCMLSPRR